MQRNYHPINRMALVILAFALVANGQTNKRISQKYDKFKDTTRVTLKLYNVGGSSDSAFYGGRLSMAASFVFRGQQLQAAPEDVVMSFTSTSQEWQYLYSRDLYAIVDGERMSLGTAERFSEVGRGTVQEELVLLIPLDTFARIANATTVEMKLGRKEFALKEEHLKRFRDLFALMRP